VREYERYFERLEQAGLGQIKRPDLLIFSKSDRIAVEDTVDRVGGTQELPFTSENHKDIQLLLRKAVIAVECENSLWQAGKMPDYGTDLKPTRRLGGKLGLRKGAVLPTIILKEEDRNPLLLWQTQTGIKIHIWHVFYDMAFGLAFDKAQSLIESGMIEPTTQTFQAPGGATTRKTIYKIYYQYAYRLGETREEPKLVALHIVDKNGHILPYVRFDGGTLTINPEAIQVLDQIRANKKESL
jgi:hypothetical protein